MIKFFNSFKDIDSSIVNVMKIGFKFSFIIGLFFTYILFFYAQNPVSHTIFDVGYLGVKCSITMFVSFLVGALGSYTIKKQSI